MTPLLFAAALAIAGPQPAQALDPGVAWSPSPVAPLGPSTAACARLGAQTVAPDGVRMFKRLDRLPWGVLEHAVWRTVGGCPVREIRYQGQTYYVASGNPRLEYDLRGSRISRRDAR